MEKVKRIHIFEDDARMLEDRFWTRRTTRTDFKVVFERVNKVLNQLIADSPNVFEEFLQRWAIDDANHEHEKGQS